MLTTRTERARSLTARATAAGLLALVGAALFALAPRADAAFTVSECGGIDVIGRGASFANTFHTNEAATFKALYCAPATAPTVTYQPQGSGAGRTAMIDRADASGARFGQSDEPPSVSEVQQMNAGTTDPGSDANPNDNAEVLQIPATIGAVAALVNWPDGCDIADLPDASETDTANPTTYDRVRFTKAQFESIWEGTTGFRTWREVFPTLADNAACNMAITRVVRLDNSGTTFAFKDYLSTIDPSATPAWRDKMFGSPANMSWPGATYGERTDCGAGVQGPGIEADATDHLTSGCSNGNGALVSKLASTDGSVGYSDLATARNAAAGLTLDGSVGDNNNPYWTQIQNGDGAFTEPTVDTNGFKSTGTKGSLCTDAVIENVPASASGDWSNVTAVNSTGIAYGICTMTFGLVFKDNAAAWGNTTEEQQKARTVKDYWDFVTSDTAQSLASGYDYAPLPADILAIDRAAVESIDWNVSGSTTPPTDDGDEPTDDGDDDEPTDDVNVRPDNQFSIPKKEVSSKKGTATISVRLPGAGQLVMIGTAKKPKSKVASAKTIQVGKVTLNATKADTYELTLKSSSAAKKVLKKKGKLKTNLELTFTPTGGDPNTQSTSVTLRKKKK